MSNLPECFCADMDDCNWTVSATLEVQNADASIGPKNTLFWSMTQVPQALAQAIMTLQTKLLNEQGAEIYLDMLKACHGNEGAAVAATMRKLLNLPN